MTRAYCLSLCSAALALLSLISPLSAQDWVRYGPGTRKQASAIYDAATDQMIMFGGQHTPTVTVFNDTWSLKNVIATSQSTFDSQNWVGVGISGNVPKARFGHTAVYNATSDRMIVFGGGTGFPGPCVNDLWVLTHANSVGGSPAWVQLSPTGTLPPIREGHTAAYDSTSNTMIVFGGTDCNGNYYDDVWILSGADGSTGTSKWTQAKATGGGPSARSQSTVIYDSVDKIMTLFGGADGSTAFNDVWLLSSGSKGSPVWTQLSPTGGGPSARSAHTAVYDSTNNRMIVHGGTNSSGTTLNDTWILTNPNDRGGTPAWTQLVPTQPGPFRSSHTAIYDPVSNEMIIFGGDSQLPVNFTDDHALVLTNANGLN